MDFYLLRLWNRGCNYMVGNPGDMCNKCGSKHEMTAVEAEVGLFDKGAFDEKD